MAQYIIDIGAVPDDGQGDPLRTAFDYTNENFNQIFAAGPVLSNIQIANNTITTTVLNSNLILSPSGIGRVQFNNTLFPRLNDVYDIGTPSLRFNSIYLGTGGIDTTGGISTTGNVTAGYFIGNGSQLTGIVATTGSEVVNGNSNLVIPSPGSNIFVTVNNTSNVVTFANTGVYIVGTVSATGNIAGNYILGNGALLSGINIGYGNSNVADFLPTYTGNLVSLTGPVTTTANVTGGNLRTAGQISATGNIIGGNIDTGRLDADYITTIGTVSASGNITGGNLTGTSVTATVISATTNVVGGNIVTTGYVSATGNITAGNLNAPTGKVIVSAVSATGNVQGGNVITTGQISATGNITGGNIDTSRLDADYITTVGYVSAIGNVYGNNFIGNVTAINYSVTGNIVAGNVISLGAISAVANVSGNYFIGNGALLTGITVTAGTSLINGTSNVIVEPSGNINMAAAGTGNVVTIANTGIYVNGLVSVSGNIAGNYILGNGAFLTGVASSYGNADVANYLPTYTGNLVSLTGPVTTTANVTGANLLTIGVVSAGGNVYGNAILSDNYLYANGQPIPTGIVYTANISPPAGPDIGDQWYDTTNDVLYEYISDGTSTYWVDTNSPAFAGGVVANVAISGNMLPVANVTFNIGNASSYFNTAFLQTVSVAGNVVAGQVRSDTVTASVLANTTAINLQTNGTNALSVDSNQYITTYRRFAASSMPLGSVIQTVMSSSLGGSITNSTSYVDVSLATVTITPSSVTSRIVLLATGTTSFSSLAGANITADTQLVRSPSISLQIQNYGSNIAGGGIGGAGSIAYSYQDSPGTTSAVTYKLQQKISNASSTLTSTNCWLIAMEIAA